eukprot:192183_1
MPLSDLKTFASPENYVQGKDAISYLGEQMIKMDLKGPVLVVSSPCPRLCLESKWTKSLSESGFDFANFEFGGNCTVAEAERIATEAESLAAKTVVAFGGGQVIDCVRAASCLIDKCEFVSCPTIASTDAPCSKLCVMYSQLDHSFHEYRFSKRHPTLVLVDTMVIAQAPVRMFVGGLGDALATFYEARSIREAGTTNFLEGKPTEASFALCQLCRDILLKDGATAVQAVEVNAVTPALERVVEANTLLSGLGFESGGLYIAHSVHNGLTSQPNHNSYTHGEKVAFGLLTQLILEGKPKEEIDEVVQFCLDVGLPVTLDDVGVNADNEMAIYEIATRSLAPGESSHKGVIHITIDMMIHAILAADRYGMSFCN